MTPRVMAPFARTRHARAFPCARLLRALHTSHRHLTPATIYMGRLQRCRGGAHVNVARRSPTHPPHLPQGYRGIEAQPLCLSPSLLCAINMITSHIF